MYKKDTHLIHVRLVPDAFSSLDRISRLSGLNYTRILNRILIYLSLEDEKDLSKSEIYRYVSRY